MFSVCRDARCVRLCRVYGLALVYAVDSQVVPTVLSGCMRTPAQLVMFALRLSWWMERLISLLQCLLRSPLPRRLAGPRASQWIAQLYSLRFQEVCFALLRFQDFSVVFYVPAAMLFWAAFSDGYGGYACCDEYSLEFLFGAAMLIASLAGGEHSALHFVRDVAGSVLC